MARLNFVNAYAVNTATTLAAKEQNSIDFSTTSLGTATISDGSGGVNFSGNDVVVKLTISGVDYFGWISRPIKSGGDVKGFYFWRDTNFGDLTAATTDGNRDIDGIDTDNTGFVLVVDQAWFTTQINGAAIANVGSSSDRVDSSLNSVLPTNTAPTAVADTSNLALSAGASGGPALEAGGVNNGTAGANAIGNVLTNDTDSAGDTKTVQKIGTGSATTDVSAGTQVTGTYGTLTIGPDGAYSYAVNNNSSAVQKLRLTTDTLTDTFTYKMVDSSGASSTATLTVSIQGANDAPVAVADYNTAKESITGVTGYNATGNVLTNDTDVDGYGESKALASGTITLASYQTVAPTSTLTFRGANSLNSVGAGDEAWILIGSTYHVLLNSAGNPINVTSITSLGGTDWDIRLSAVPAAYYKSGGNVSISGTSFLADKTVGFLNDNSPTTTTSNSIKTATVSSTTSAGGSAVTVASSTVDLQVGMSISGTGIPADTVITGVTTTNGVTTITLDKVITSTQTATINTSSAGTYVGSHGVLVLAADGSYTYTPTADNPFLSGGQSATETFSYSIVDASGLASRSTLNITVYGSSATEPVAKPDLATATPGTSGGAALEAGAGVTTIDATGNVISNDTTPSGTIRVIGAKLGPSGSDQSVTSGTTSANGTQITGTYGTLTIGADGTYRYVVNNSNTTVQALNAGESLQELFSYTIQNGSTAPNTSTAYLTVQVNGSNDAPTAGDDSALAQEKGGLSNTINGLDPSGSVIGNDLDVDNLQSTLRVTGVRTGAEGVTGSNVQQVNSSTNSANGTQIVGSYGTLTIGSDGTWTYAVDNSNAQVEGLGDGQTLSDDFTYTVKDSAGTGAGDTATLSITIQGAADTVTVSNVFVNEASPYAVFEITGGVGQSVTLSLGNSTGLATNDAKVTLGTDLGTALELLSGGTWQPYVQASPPTIPAGGKLLVRVAITPDTLAEGNEAFTLDATTRDGSVARGIGTIGDEGDGSIFLAGNVTTTPNTSSDAGYPARLDDDRRVALADVSVAETAGHAVFNVTGASGQLVQLSLSDGSATGGADYASALEYLNGATWQSYTANSFIAIPAGGILQVRTSITDDALSEGNETFTLTVTNAGGTSATATATIVDNESASLTMTGGPLTTTEAGGTAQFNIVLSNQPNADVTVTITGLDATEGTLSTTTLTFTSSNWNVAQTITVTGVDDLLVDGSQSYTLTGTATGGGYTGQTATVGVTNTDDDVGGLIITGSSLTTAEAGQNASFTVKLASQPTHDVTITIASGDTTEGTVGPTTLTFTSSNWSTAQTVTVTHVDDQIVDGNITYNVGLSAASTDTSYQGLTSNVFVTNNDNDTAAIISIADVSIAESGGSATITFTRTGATGGASSVTWTTSNGTATGGVDFTGGTGTVNFAAGETSKTITIPMSDDSIAEGSEAFTVTLSGASGASIGGSGSATVTITDDDNAALVIGGGALATTEAGQNASFTVKLASQPTHDVTITITSGDTTEGTVGPTTLTFTSGNWNTAQTVTVTHVDDQIVDGNITYNVGLSAVSTDTSYQGLTSNVSVTNNDNDTAAIISIADVSIAESGGSATITFTRTGATGGASSVTWTTSNGTATGGADFTGGTGTVNFAAGETSKTITIPISDDSIAEGSEAFTVTLSGASGASIGGSGSATFTITDDDNAALVIGGGALATTEAGQNASFTIKLASQPTHDVTLTVASSDTTEGTVSPTTLTFTTSNWNTPQTVTVTHVDDQIVDGTIAYSIDLNASSTDSNYQGLSTSVAATNADNDTAATISIADVSISESGGSATLTFTRSGATGTAASVAWATSQGTATGGADFTIGSGTVNFAAGETSKTITIPIINDSIAEGDEAFTVTLNSASGATIGTGTASVTITDNDTAGITITGGPLTTTEVGATATFTVVLTSQPTANVTVILTGLDATEGTLSATTLIFTDQNWNQPQTITVTGVDDTLFDGNQSYTLTATANGGGYVNKTGTVSITNQDNEMPVPPVITNVTETVTDPTPNDLLTGDVTQVLTITGTPGFSIKLYTSAGQLIPTAGYTVTETAPGTFRLDAQGINLAAGRYVVRQTDSNGHESANSNSFVIDTTPELEEKIAARSVHGANILTGQFEVIDQNRVNLAPFQGSPPITQWFDADGEQVIFGVQGGAITGNFVTATLANGAFLRINKLTGEYTYNPDANSTLDSFGVTVRDPGGKGGNLTVNFETRDLLDRDGVPGNSEDQLATRLTGVSDNNGDGIADSTQNAVTTMAWTRNGHFSKAVQGQINDVPTTSVITVVANENAQGNQVSQIAQLINFNVLQVNRDGSGGLPLTNIPNVATPWDALAFSLEPLQSLGLVDIDPNRAGLQQRITVDISKANVREGDFQAYYKWISADTIIAAQNAGVALVTLDGVTLTNVNQAGWYDFTSRVAGGDGARYIVNQGMITGIELILTDNAFGDIDFTVGRITDPGMPVSFNQTNPQPQPNDTTPPVISGPSGLPGASATVKQVYENTTPVFTFSANENVTWSISGDIDSAQFRFGTDGTLFFINAPDFEVPADSGRNNVYDVTIRAIDAAGNASQQAVSVSVLDVLESVPTTPTPVAPTPVISNTRPVYTIDLRSGDRMLTMDAQQAALVAQGEGSTPGIQFWVRPDAAPGFVALAAWQNVLTGDLFYAPQGTELPYACYQAIDVGPLGYVARPGQGVFDLHLWIGAEGITHIVSNAEAAQIGLPSKGYSDLGALFASV